MIFDGFRALESPIHYQTDGCTQVRPFFLFRIPSPLRQF
nr:MAG TPA: hypothetical protein [Caudoviricetes sp.]